MDEKYGQWVGLDVKREDTKMKLKASIDWTCNPQARRLRGRQNKRLMNWTLRDLDRLEVTDKESRTVIQHRRKSVTVAVKPLTELLSNSAVKEGLREEYSRFACSVMRATKTVQR